MNLVTIIKAILPVEPIHPRTEGTPLRPGDQLQGRVLKVNQDGTASMDFERFRAITKVPMPVQTGQTFTLEVLRADDPVEMRIITSSGLRSAQSPTSATTAPTIRFTPELLQQLRIDISQLDLIFSKQPAVYPPESIQNALETLKPLLAGLDVTSEPAKLALQIQKWVENSGLFFENKLAALLPPISGHPPGDPTNTSRMRPNSVMRSDFKFAFLSLLDFLTKIDSGRLPGQAALIQRLKKALGAFLKDLTDQKKMAIKRSSTEDPLQIFHVMLPVMNQKMPGRLKLYYTKSPKAAREATPRVSLLLELEYLGRVRSDFLLLGKDLSVSFYVDEDHVKSFFDRRMGEVKSILEAWFDTVTLSVTVSHQKINAFDAPLSTHGSDHKVDLRI